MRKFILFAVCVSIVLSSILCVTAMNRNAQPGKILYTDFTTKLIADTPVSSGNGEHTIHPYSGYTVTALTQENGELSMKIQNGNYIRFANTLDLKTISPKYMVVRMKGTNDWGAGLTGNALKFWFGSWGSMGAGIYMSHTQLTEDYSDVVLSIPEGYFNTISSTDLFITSERGATFDVSIDEIYFCNQYPLEEPEEDFEKHIYSNFDQELILNTPVVSDGADGRITLFYAELCAPTVSEGALKVTYNTADSYVRFTNTLALTDSTKKSIYKYMVFRMRGTAKTKDGAPYTNGRLLNIVMGNWGNEGHPVSVDASVLSSDEYTDVVIELNDINFAGTASGYESGLIIRNGANINLELDIDEIYFCDTPPSSDDEDEKEDEEPVQSVIYSEFTDALVQGSPVSNGADGTITLFATENATQSVSDGVLNLNIKADGYIRFTSSTVLTDDLRTPKYKYMLLKIKGSAKKSDGSAVTGDLLNVIIGSWGNEGSPIKVSASQIKADEFTTLVLELSDKNFSNTHADYASGLIFRNAVNCDSNIVIDSISFTDTRPESDTPPLIPENPEKPEITTDFIYSEFTDALVEGTAVPNGADGTITLFATENATQSVKDGVLDLNLKADGYIRFTSSLPLTDDCMTSKYKYMVMKIKGSAKKSDGSAVDGDLIKVIFGSWGNEGAPISVSASQIKADEYTTLILELSDKNFANTHADYASGLIFRNAGNFESSFGIDSIYFTDVKPEAAPVVPSKPNTTEKKVKNYYSDFSTALVEGTAVSNGDDGTITLFNMVDCTQKTSNGAIELKLSGEGAYARFTSSLKLTDDLKTSKYKYMVVSLKGSVASAAGGAASGNAIKFIMGSWGNEANPVLLSASGITKDYNTLVFELKDASFANTHADYAGGLIIQNAGNYKTELIIDEIYFTDVKPAGSIANQGGSSGAGGSSSSGSDSESTTDKNDSTASDTDTDKNDGEQSVAPSENDKETLVSAISYGNPTLGIVMVCVFAAVIVAFSIFGAALVLRSNKKVGA